MEINATGTKIIQIDSDFSPHRSEVLAAEAQAAIRSGHTAFRFMVGPGFLPSIGWLDRLRILLEPLVREKHPVEITCSHMQHQSMRRAGMNLIADIEVSAS